MVKQRASLAGRGLEILFGPELEQPSSLDSQPDASSALSASADSAFDDGHNGDRDQASAKEPDGSVGAELEPSPVGDESAVKAAETREEELAESTDDRLSRLSEATLPPLATTPARPTASSAARSGFVGDPDGLRYGTPPSPMYVPSYTASEELPASLPPPKEKPEATDPAVQAKLMDAHYGEPTMGPYRQARASARLVQEETMDPQSSQPSRVREEEEVLDYVGLDQRQALWNQVMELYDTVPDVLCTDENLSRALHLLHETQDILMEMPRQFDVARYKVSQVQGMVSRRIHTSRWANTYGWAAFLYEMVWIITLVLALLTSPAVAEWVAEMNGTTQTVDPKFSIMWNTVVWGGMGGVIGALYSLYWHAAKVKDFDKQYFMWYIVQPVIGLLLGGLVYLIIGAGLMVALAGAVPESLVVRPLFSYAVACIAGFRQRFILELIDRVIQLLTPSPTERQRTTEEASPEEAKA